MKDHQATKDELKDVRQAHRDLVELIKKERKDHQAAINETIEKTQKAFFSMDLIASFLDYVPDEDKEKAYKSYIQAVSNKIMELKNK